MKVGFFCLTTVLSFPLFGFAQNSVLAEPAPMQMKTRWTDQVSVSNVLGEYPRPQMVRCNWINLNGLWDYKITGKDDDNPPTLYEGQILVPFPIESALSRVQKPLLQQQQLWYKRHFEIPATTDGHRVLLHFGAVDQQTNIYINGKHVGNHSGGYDSFQFDITEALRPGDNELVVSVWDPTDSGDAPHGKQVLNPRRIFYTAISGIWQTVWLEAVPPASIASLYMTPDIDNGHLSIQVEGRGSLEGATVKLVAKTDGKVAGQIVGKPGELLKLPIINARLWQPDTPILYDLSVVLQKKGKGLDTVTSYFGMRKIEIKKDEMGIERIFLNNRYTFNLGVLDQGYWPDGLYTAATDEALKFDIEAIKAMGFNTIRKHIKVEPARWYYHCDKAGMLVWQDMPSWFQRKEMSAAAKENFEIEAALHLKNLHNYPCIISWVLFNEDWGAFDQQRLAPWMKALDPSRILNANSGSFVKNWMGSELTDLHNYPDPTLPPYQKNKAMVCGEFGGTFAPVEGHEWIPGKGFGHSSPPGFTFRERYEHMTDHLRLLEKEGLSGSIFTEPFDVEMEENGLMTYDREIYKIPVGIIKKLNQSVLSK